MRRNPVPPDAPVCGPHQSDVEPTLDVSAHPIVGLPPLCCEENGDPFQGRHRLHTHQPVDGGKEGREVLKLLEACLQVHLLLRPIRPLQTLFLCLHIMRLSICVHDAHVVNTTSTIISEVMDKEATLLLIGL